MISRSKAWLLTTGAAIALAAPAIADPAAAPAEAAAADTGPQDEIIVTAQKREQRLLDVPQSVSVLSGETLRTIHAERFADYFTRLPSASIVEDQAGQTRLI